MNWNAIVGIAATTSMLLPIAAIIYYKLYRHRSLAALLISYLLAAVYNVLSSGLFPISKEVVNAAGVLSHYLDIPLMLTALLFFCPIKQKQKSVHIITGVFIAYEIVIACIFRLDYKAMVYIMGPGLGLILIYSFYLFARHIRIAIEFGKNAGRSIMLVSILFGYGCYGLVYFFYYIQKAPDAADAFLLYFIATFVASILMAVGLLLTRKRLQELEEIKNTRRELAIFFNN